VVIVDDYHTKKMGSGHIYLAWQRRKNMSNLIEFLEADGNTLKKTASTNGGEYHSPCPACGGEDRFAVWPEQGKYGCYWCRRCEISGDSIQYLRDFQGMTYPEAAERVGKPINPYPNQRITTTRKTLKKEKIMDKENPKPPNEAWQDRSSARVNFAHEALLAIGNKLEWLKKERGITTDSVKRHQLGYVFKNLYFERTQWGLPQELKENGKPKKIFIPSGLLIPYMPSGKPIRIRVRRDDPGEYGRYYIVPGSSLEPMIIMPDGEAENHPVIIVESELDAILLRQELSSPCIVVGLGSAQAKPHADLVALLKLAPAIIVALDADTAGNKATQFWCEHFPQAMWFPMLRECGKDPTEAFISGLDLNLWHEAAWIAIRKNTPP
jgi:DNA primase